MSTVLTQIQSADGTICRNIETLTDDRELLSQNILSQLRNLVEGIAVLLHTGTGDAEFKYDAIEPGLAFVKSQAKLNFLGRFHKLLKISTSDWSPFLIPGGIRVMGSYHSLRGRVGIRRIPTGGEFNRCRVA